jgi:phosphate transport system substrate-binding protein
LICLALLSLGLCSCSGKPGKPHRPNHFKGAGASYPAVLYKHWFDEYEKQNDDVSIEYDSVGSGKGVERFLTGDSDKQLDFAASDNGLNEEEAKQVKRGVVQIPLAGGMITLVYNLPGVYDLKLSREAYTGIFNGKIKRWNDDAIKKTNPNAELPDREITVVVRKDGSGTTYHFSNHLSAASREWKHGARRTIPWPAAFSQQNQNDGVSNMVIHTIGAIGYVDLGTAQQAKDRLHLARLENKSGEFIEPTPQHAMSALASAKNVASKPVFVADPEGKQDYPIVGFTYVMLYREYDDAKRLDALKKLFQWCLTEGQSACKQLGYVSLPPTTAAEALERVKKLGS